MRVARAFKLLVLVASFLAIGFFGVLVIDVGASVVGQVRLGEITVAGLWHKVMDRFLDKDVPRAPEASPSSPRKVAGARPARGPGSATPAQAPGVASPVARAADRAPAPASRPEDDARHVGERPRADPQVEHARRRLDELLGRL